MLSKRFVALAIVLIASVVLVWFSTSIRGRETTYEVRPQISVPEYRTDAARAIDAYERLMERYMDLTEKHLSWRDGSSRVVVEKLMRIDTKLSELSERIAGIERALGIDGAGSGQFESDGEDPNRVSGR